MDPMWPSRGHVPGSPPRASRSRAGDAVGYTPGMKTAVSVPDDLFAQVDRLARRSRRSRSEVYSAALREYLARHEPDEVTATLDKVVSELTRDADLFVDEAARRTLRGTDW
jgi:Arc/MetJ-type ribon-helix-helix transcriptional regulator